MPKVVCPNGHRLQVQDGHIGQVINCPSCQAAFVAQPEAGEGAFQSLGGGGGSFGGGSVARTGGGSGVGRFFNLAVGKPLLFFGLILVVLGRGCDATSLRSVARTSAYYQDQRQQFDNDYTAKISTKRSELDKARDSMNNSQDAATRKQWQDQINTLQKELSELQSNHRSERSQKENNEWRSYREAAQNAANAHQMWMYWFQWVFIVGTIVLMISLVTLSFTGVGPERWIAYIMIAIITFSIYVGGAAWIESIASSFMSAGQRPPIGGEPPFGKS